MLWLCEPFDQEFSFRDALEQVVEAVQGADGGNASYSLPVERTGEDFVEGKFSWNEREFDLYYERSLGYMQFSTTTSSIQELENLRTTLLANALFR